MQPTHPGEEATATCDVSISCGGNRSSRGVSLYSSHAIDGTTPDVSLYRIATHGSRDLSVHRGDANGTSRGASLYRSATNGSRDLSVSRGDANGTSRGASLYSAAAANGTSRGASLYRSTTNGSRDLSVSRGDANRSTHDGSLYRTATNGSRADVSVHRSVLYATYDVSVSRSDVTTTRDGSIYRGVAFATFDVSVPCGDAGAVRDISIYRGSANASRDVSVYCAAASGACDVSTSKGSTAKNGHLALSVAAAVAAADAAAVLKQSACLTGVQKLRQWFGWYASQWRGVGDKPPAIPPFLELCVTFVGAFSALLLILALTRYVSPLMDNIPWVVTSFGASTTLLFAVPEAKVAQPRNCVGGQLIGATVGVCVRLAIGGEYLWVSGALGTALAITIMQLTRCTHPPGGGTALAASIMPKLAPYQGFQIVITAMIGNFCLVLVALIVNNTSPKRRYPLYWFNEKF